MGSLTGGGGLSASAGGGTTGPQKASTGDTSSNLALDFTSNNAFSVGGSGLLDQNATAASKSPDYSGASNPFKSDSTLTYIGIAAAVLALIGVGYIVYRRA